MTDLLRRRWPAVTLAAPLGLLLLAGGMLLHRVESSARALEEDHLRVKRSETRLELDLALERERVARLRGEVETLLAQKSALETDYEETMGDLAEQNRRLRKQVREWKEWSDSVRANWEKQNLATAQKINELTRRNQRLWKEAQHWALQNVSTVRQASELSKQNQVLSKQVASWRDWSHGVQQDRQIQGLATATRREPMRIDTGDP